MASSGGADLKSLWFNPPVLANKRRSKEDATPTTPEAAAAPPPPSPAPAAPLLGWSTKDRRGLWAAVLARTEGIRSQELEVVKALAGGRKWLDWVDPDHVAIYSSIYEETKDRPARDAAKIEKDVPRTFRVFLQDDWLARTVHDWNRSERHAALNRLLNLASSITDCYCQGMNFIAGLLLLQLPSEKEAFIVLAWIIRQRKLDALYSGKGYGLVVYTSKLEEMLEKQAPTIHQHFQDLQFTAVMYSVEWFTTLFSTTCSKLLSLSVLDLFMAGVNEVLLRVGVALLQLLEPVILPLDFEDLHMNFKKAINSLPPELVLARALRVEVEEGADSLWQAEMMQDGPSPTGEESSPAGTQSMASTSSGPEDVDGAQGTLEADADLHDGECTAKVGSTDIM